MGTYSEQSREFKFKIMELHYHQNVSIKVLSEKFGIPQQTIYSWRNEYRKYSKDAFVGCGRQRPADAELRKLKSENENDFIFRQKNGKMISLSTISNWWREYASKVGITKGVTFHGLRHSAASFMIYKGIDIATVSRTLGHSKISTTLNIYTHAMEDNKSRAISAAAEMFE